MGEKCPGANCSTIFWGFLKITFVKKYNVKHNKYYLVKSADSL